MIFLSLSQLLQQIRAKNLRMQIEWKQKPNENVNDHSLRNENFCCRRGMLTCTHGLHRFTHSPSESLE